MIASAVVSTFKTGSCQLLQVEYQTGKFSAVAELEERRRNALGDQPHTETVRLALLKYRSVILYYLTHAL